MTRAMGAVPAIRASGERGRACALSPKWALLPILIPAACCSSPEDLHWEIGDALRSRLECASRADEAGRRPIERTLKRLVPNAHGSVGAVDRDARIAIVDLDEDPVASRPGDRVVVVRGDSAIARGAIICIGDGWIAARWTDELRASVIEPGDAVLIPLRMSPSPPIDPIERP